ncbi:MAG: FtsX-like permease family protein [Planctomycetota bacterium]
MYAALLARKYLTTKVIPLLAAFAVTLCVATELIVWSVMGGFLANLVDEGRRMDGDLRITWEHVGFAHYADLVHRLEADPAVAAATPLIETLGLIGLPNDRRLSVQLLGIEPASYAEATIYADSLYWRPQTEPNRLDEDREDPRLREDNHDILAGWLADGARLDEFDPDTGATKAAIVMGIASAGWNQRQPGNWYLPRYNERLLADGGVRPAPQYLPRTSVAVTVLPLGRGGNADELDLRTLEFPVANELYTGNYAVDARQAFVPLSVLQDMLQMGPAKRVAPGQSPFAVQVDDEGRESFGLPEIAGEAPARVTDVLVRAAPGVSPVDLEAVCLRVYEDFEADHPGDVPIPQYIGLNTFEERNAGFIAAVQKETTLVLFIFGVVSLTSVFLVLAIFWAMVSEKTRDIGILRAIGASRTGVAAVWVGYGLAIGIVGSALGSALAAIVVSNINPIHEWLGAALGVQIWDPNVYYFTTIPTDLDAFKFAVIAASGVVASVLGALVPAARAALMDPVKALRFD